MKKYLLILLLLSLPVYGSNVPPPGVSSDIIINNGNGQYGPLGNGVRAITSGTTDTSQKDDGLIEWTTSANAPLTETILPGSINGQSLNIADGQGTAGTYHVTLMAGSGATIGGASSLVLSDNFFNISLKWYNFANWIVTDYYNGAKSVTAPSYLLFSAGTIFAVGNGNYIKLY